jgi:hypothetical protein
MNWSAWSVDDNKMQVDGPMAVNEAIEIPDDDAGEVVEIDDDDDEPAVNDGNTTEKATYNVGIGSSHAAPVATGNRRVLRARQQQPPPPMMSALSAERHAATMAELHPAIGSRKKSDDQLRVHLARGYPHSLKRSSLQTVFGNDEEWLNDEAINMFCRVVIDCDQLARPSHVYSTFFMRKFLQEEDDNLLVRDIPNYGLVKTLSKKVPGSCAVLKSRTTAAMWNETQLTLSLTLVVLVVISSNCEHFQFPSTLATIIGRLLWSTLRRRRCATLTAWAVMATNTSKL